MIVNLVEQHWEIIYQPAHALLSGEFARQWRRDARPVRWWPTLHAVAQHDNGWWEWERTPRIGENGAPRNFTEITATESLAQWERGISRGRHQSRWIGLLISRHATSLWESRRGESPELDRFLEEQQAQQEAWRKQVGATPEEVAAAYRLLGWTDWLSLILCWRRLSPDGKPLSVGEGPDGIRYQAMQVGESTVRLEPWPFESERFEAAVEARLLDQASFSSDDALRVALEGALPHVRRWELVP